MVYQPTYMSPSPFVGDGGDIIDAAVANVLSAQIVSDEPIGAYRVIIYADTAQNSIVFDSGKVTTSTAICALPFYPNTPSGAVVQWRYSLPANSLTNGNAYKWTLSLWANSRVSAGDADIVSADVAFLAKPTPTIAITNALQDIEAISYTWTGSVTNASSLMWIRWVLSFADGEVVEDTGKMYITAEIKYTYSSLANNTSYKIQLFAMTKDGVAMQSNVEEFSVYYDVVTLTNGLTTKNTDDAGILVEWGSIQYIMGEDSVSPTVYQANTPRPNLVSVSLVEGETISFVDNESFSISPNDDDVHCWFGFVQGNGEIYRFENSVQQIIATISDYSAVLTPQASLMPRTSLTPSNGSFTLTVIFNKSGEQSNSSTQQVVTVDNITGGNWYRFAFQQNSSGEAVVQIKRPEDDGAILVSEHAVEYSDILFSDIPTKVQISNAQICSWLWISKATDIPEYSDALLDSVSPSMIPWDKPTWQPDTKFLVTFNNTLLAGNASLGGVSPDEWILYRNDIVANLKTIVGAFPIDTTRCIDYLVANGREYSYELQGRSSNSTYNAATIASAAIMARFDSVCLIVANNTDNAGQFEADCVFMFGLNVEGMSLSNNVQVNKLMGFTPYYRIQKANLNCYTGRISSLIGYIVCDSASPYFGEYYDDIEMATAIKALTTDTREKFLKDLKGHIWRVDLTAGVSFTEESFSDRAPYKQELEWTEVGTLDGISVVGMAVV